MWIVVTDYKGDDTLVNTDFLVHLYPRRLLKEESNTEYVIGTALVFVNGSMTTRTNMWDIRRMFSSESSEED